MEQLTKEEQVAAMALQGLLSNPEFLKSALKISDNGLEVISHAVKTAKEVSEEFFKK